MRPALRCLISLIRKTHGKTSDEWCGDGDQLSGNEKHCSKKCRKSDWHARKQPLGYRSLKNHYLKGERGHAQLFATSSQFPLKKNNTQKDKTIDVIGLGFAFSNFGQMMSMVCLIL